MKIVVFSDAKHQHRYADVVRQAMAIDDGVFVESVCMADVVVHSEKSNNRVACAVRTGMRRIKLLDRILGFMSEMSSHIKGTVESWVKSTTFGCYIKYRRMGKIIHSKVFVGGVDLIVLLEDNAEGYSGIVSSMARARRVPYVVLPDFIPNPAEPANVYAFNPLHRADTLRGRLVRFFLPAWAATFEGVSLLRLSPQQIVAQKLCGQSCIQPWILNAGYAEAIFIDSLASKRHYERLGFSSDKLRLIGGAADDAFFEVACRRSVSRHSIYTKYGFESKRPLFVVAFPPDQYSVKCDSYEFESFERMVFEWMRVLGEASAEVNVLVVLHPRLDRNRINFSCKRSVSIAEETLSEVLPLADVYIASVSTTIKHALALGVPVVNYDCYRYKYNDFSDADGVIEVSNVEAFAAAVKSLLLEGAYQDLKRRAELDSANWGVIDGGFKLRLRENLLCIRGGYCGFLTPTHDASFLLSSVG